MILLPQPVLLPFVETSSNLYVNTGLPYKETLPFIRTTILPNMATLPFMETIYYESDPRQRDSISEYD